MTLGLCGARDSVTIDQKLNMVPRTPGPWNCDRRPAIRQVVLNQRLHDRERRTIHRVWIAPDNFHEILPCLERAVLANSFFEVSIR